MTDLIALAAPFQPIRVSWRIGSTNQDKTKGMALAYIDARDVMERFDEACGPAGWQCRYSHAGAKTVCDIAVKVGDEWIWKADGAGDSDVEAEKGALSDAFKRAAVKWGVGRYLYDLKSPWVEIEQRGRTSIIKDAEYTKLGRLLQAHFDEWIARGSGGGKAETAFRQHAGDEWAAWAKGDTAKRWLTDAKRDLGVMVNAEDVGKWQRAAGKELRALDQHSPERHAWIMGIVNDKLTTLGARAA